MAKKANNTAPELEIQASENVEGASTSGNASNETPAKAVEPKVQQPSCAFNFKDKGVPVWNADGFSHLEKISDFDFSKHSPAKYYVSATIQEGVDTIDNKPVPRFGKPKLIDIPVRTFDDLVDKALALLGVWDPNAKMNVPFTHFLDSEVNGAASGMPQFKKTSEVRIACMMYAFRNYDKLVKYQPSLLRLAPNENAGSLEARARAEAERVFTMNIGGYLFKVSDILHIPFGESPDYSSDAYCLGVIPDNIKNTLGWK